MAKEIFWQIKDITMSFPGVKALDNVSLDIYKGEILGLLGENGSGKSTFIKCLSGVHVPQSGQFIKNGEVVKFANSSDSQRQGVATVYQEFSLVSTLSVTENIYLGRLLKDKNGFVDWKSMRAKTLEILNTLQIDLDPDKIVSELSVAEQQLTEIVKGYTANGSLMILDEPTTALTEPDILRLHALLKRLSKEGHTIIYISHRLDEVMDIVNRVAILRNGVLTGIIDRKELTIDDIVEKMSGKVISEHYPKQNNVQDEIVLKVEDIKTENGVNGVSFDVKKGEVFGLAGLLGSGRTEIAKAIFGVDKLVNGKITYKGKAIKEIDPRTAIESGFAYITENRKTDGLFFNFNGSKNSTSAKIKKLFKSNKLKLLNLKKEEQTYDESIKKLSIEPMSAYKTVNFLSGGNQQKVVISRWLFAESDFYIMDEPTQGIDIIARLQVYNIMNDLTKMGKSILLISSDYLELLSMSDRVATVKSGMITNIVNAKDADKKTILSN